MISNNEPQVSFIQLIDRIGKSPDEFLAFKSINCFASFLNGFGYVYRECQISDFELYQEQEYFEFYSKWLLKHFGAEDHHSPYSIILLYSNNEVDGFQKYFNLFETFKKQYRIEVVESKLEKANLTLKKRKQYDEGRVKVLKFEHIFSLLEYICSSPSMYLKSSNIDNLYSFISGYLQAKKFFRLKFDLEEEQFLNFQPWLERKYPSCKGISWLRIVTFYSVDEYNALEAFNKHLAEFRYTINA